MGFFCRSVYIYIGRILGECLLISGLLGEALRMLVESIGCPDNHTYTFNVELTSCFRIKLLQFYTIVILVSQSQQGSQNTRFVQNEQFYIYHILQVLHFVVY